MLTIALHLIYDGSEVHLGGQSSRLLCIFSSYVVFYSFPVNSSVSFNILTIAQFSTCNFLLLIFNGLINSTPANEFIIIRMIASGILIRKVYPQATRAGEQYFFYSYSWMSSRKVKCKYNSLPRSNLTPKGLLE